MRKKGGPEFECQWSYLLPYTAVNRQSDLPSGLLLNLLGKVPVKY